MEEIRDAIKKKGKELSSCSPATSLEKCNYDFYLWARKVSLYNYGFVQAEYTLIYKEIYSVNTVNKSEKLFH